MQLAPDIAPQLSPPGRAAARKCATRSKPLSRLPTKISPPQMLPSSPKPVPSKLTPTILFVPFAALRKNRSQMRSMVLYCSCLVGGHRGAMAG